MKKIFLSYAHQDNEIAKIIFDIIQAAGYQVNYDRELSCEMDFWEQVKTEIRQSDLLIAIVTNHYIDSDAAQTELSQIAYGAKTPLFTLEIGNVLFPAYMIDIVREIYQVDRFDQFDPNIFLAKLSRLKEKQHVASGDCQEDKEKALSENVDEKIKVIKKKLSELRLTLVCGAGVSSSIGLPDWNTLLGRMLNHALLLKHNDFTDREMDKLMSSSQLIVGNYLKILLGEKFDDVVATCLYEDSRANGDRAYTESALIKSIIELIRPKRNSGNVESVITFNFDSILEEFLTKYSIKHKAIYEEGSAFDADEIPIYHVHGYLPKNEKIKTHNLVFSEDGYHTQFIDPYNWSNLIQLYKYMNNSCLFVGVSLADPNLRRILDISKRKNETDGQKHFIIKKSPTKDSPVYGIQRMLEEKDALSLGLNVIWVSDYDEYSGVLEKILN